MYVLAEGWDSGELADEVEVGGSQGMNSTSVIDRQRLVRRQGQVLHRRQAHITGIKLSMLTCLKVFIFIKKN